MLKDSYLIQADTTAMVFGYTSIVAGSTYDKAHAAAEIWG